MSFLLKLSKPVLFLGEPALQEGFPTEATAFPLGGANDGGFLVGWFKTAKHRFGLHRFGESALQEGFPTEATAFPLGQGTLWRVYRWLVLSLISYILAHWAYLSTAMPAASCANASTNLPDWGQAAEIAFKTIFPQLVLLFLLQDIERLKNLARKSWN